MLLPNSSWALSLRLHPFWKRTIQTEKATDWNLYCLHIFQTQAIYSMATSRHRVGKFLERVGGLKWRTPPTSGDRDRQGWEKKTNKKRACAQSAGVSVLRTQVLKRHICWVAPLEIYLYVYMYTQWTGSTPTLHTEVWLVLAYIWNDLLWW